VKKEGGVSREGIAQESLKLGDKVEAVGESGLGVNLPVSGDEVEGLLSGVGGRLEPVMKRRNQAKGIRNTARRPRWITPSSALPFVLCFRVLTRFFPLSLSGSLDFFSVSYPFIYFLLIQAKPPLHGVWDLTSVWFGRRWRDHMFSFMLCHGNSHPFQHKSLEVCAGFPSLGHSWLGLTPFPLLSH
jgi:hypothetical protein